MIELFRTDETVNILVMNSHVLAVLMFEVLYFFYGLWRAWMRISASLYCFFGSEINCRCIAQTQTPNPHPTHLYFWRGRNPERHTGNTQQIWKYSLRISFL